MESNSSLQIFKNSFTGFHNDVSLKIGKMVKQIIKVGQNLSFQLRNYFYPLLSASELKFAKILRKCNNKLNIYTELKKTYNIQNNQEENRIYLQVFYNGSQKSITKFLIVSEQYNNQSNFFNC